MKQEPKKIFVHQQNNEIQNRRHSFKLSFENSNRVGTQIVSNSDIHELKKGQAKIIAG